MANSREFTAKGLLAAAILTGCAMAQDARAAESNAFAFAQILSGLSVTTESNLEFAQIVPSSESEGIVRLSPSGERDCTEVESCHGEASAARFIVTGTPETSFSISLPSTGILQQGESGIGIDNFVDNRQGQAVLDHNGQAEITIGADLLVQPGQSEGLYGASFEVIVNYN